jgi:hypothetical protein
MTHAELIASIPTKGVECLWKNLPVTARSYTNGWVLVEREASDTYWVLEKEVSPLPERPYRPMTDREMFGLFAKGAEVQSVEMGAILKMWRVGDHATRSDSYRLPGSTEWKKCEVEVVE